MKNKNFSYTLELVNPIVLMLIFPFNYVKITQLNRNIYFINPL